MNFKTIIALVAFLFLTATCSAQAKVDSLLNELKSTNHESQTDLIRDQLQLSYDIWSRNHHISDSLLNKSIELLQSVNSPELSIRAKFMKANRLPTPEEKIRNYIELDSLVSRLNLSAKLRVDIKYKLALRLYDVKKCDESIQIYKEAIQLAREFGVDDLGRLLISITNPIIFLEDHYSAMSYFLEALEVEGDHHGRVYASIPNVCRKMEDWDNMIKYGYIGLEDAIDKRNYRREVFSLMQLGYAYMKKFDYVNARKYAEEAWRISREKKFFNRAGIILTTLIQTELEDGNIDKAISYEKELKYGNKTIALPSIYTHLAMAYVQKGEIYKAIDYCNFALENIGAESEQPYDIALYQMEAYDCLSVAYEKLKNYKKAYEAKKLYEEAKEVVKGKGAILSISKALNQQELAQQEKILKLENEQATQLYDARINRFKIIGFFGLLLLALGGFTMFQLRNRNQKIAKQNETIGKALTEKDLLLREIHHRVKNNLQLVSSLLTLQGRSINDETALQAINEGKSRVRSMALIHQDLYNKENLTGIGVKDYIEKLTQELFSTYRIDKDKISLEMQVENMILDVDTLVPLGLIINELITNSLKYAWSEGQLGMLSVSLSKLNDALVLEVQDDGVGYDHTKVSDSSFGSTLVAALAEQLEAKVSIVSNNGTSVKLVIKDE